MTQEEPCLDSGFCGEAKPQWLLRTGVLWDMVSLPWTQGTSVQCTSHSFKPHKFALSQAMSAHRASILANFAVEV